MSLHAVLRSWICAAILACGSLPGHSQDSSDWGLDFSGTLDFGAAGYFQSPAHPHQKHHPANVSFRPSLYFEHAEGGAFTLTPSFRWDTDGKEAIDVDIREGYYLTYGYLGDTEWELRVGIDQVFWGTAESDNPVNIVNQTDLAADPAGDEKLGQPMIHGTLAGAWGTLNLIALPLHRPRTYPGAEGRLRTDLPVSDKGGDIFYVDTKHDRHLGLAARYSNSISVLDFGISAFRGTSREPVLLPGNLEPEVCRNGNPRLPMKQSPEPYRHCYPQIEQIGLDLQLTLGDFIGKAEMISRSGFGVKGYRKGQDTSGYRAFVVGGEYTLYGIFESGADLTFFAEWSQDERRAYATTPWQNDLFLATRYALNDVGDTSFTAAMVDDADYPTRSLTLLFERRLNNSLSLEVEAYTFLQKPTPLDQATWHVRDDAYLSAVMSYGF
ncbi:MAG: hypothetical protein OXC91_10385 [Rhodobacteraceae bacterium]|nr:hypothetical protein [Paracoccaceae bacterium]